MSRSDLVDQYAIPDQPELADLFRSISRQVKLQVRTHSVATIKTYNPTTQKATVTVDALQVVRVVDPNKVPAQALTVVGTPPNAQATLRPFTLTGIPVAWPRTNSGYLTFPLNAGDTGTLHIQDRSIAQWLTIGQATDPVSAFIHSLADSVFQPDLHADTNPITPLTDPTATVLEGTALVKIGRAAADFPILGTTLATVLTPIIATLAAVPPATTPATVITLANANQVALLAFMNAIAPNLATKAMVE